MSKEKWIQHSFHSSHSSHKLKEVYSNCKFECQVCKDEGDGARYRCEPCKFNVHTTCGNLPESLSSFTHPQHSLSLRPNPFLVHKCRLCRDLVVKGMVYRCEAECCKFFLHPTCSLFPELLENHPKHPHPLRLRSLDNYDSKKLCDICRKKCKHWRYHCEVCDVHIHIKCLVKPTQTGTESTTDNHGGKAWTYVGRLADAIQISAVLL